MQSISLQYIDGQLKAWEYVNGKRDHGTTFYLRDMSKPFGSPNLPVDLSCIQECFQKQLSVLSRHKADVDNPICFSKVDWPFVEAALQRNLFGYLNDNVGYKLHDPTEAFNASGVSFQQSIAIETARQIRSVTQANSLFRVDNNPEYFSGCVILIDSKSVFYELRLGNYF